MGQVLKGSLEDLENVYAGKLILPKFSGMKRLETRAPDTISPQVYHRGLSPIYLHSQRFLPSAEALDCGSVLPSSLGRDRERQTHKYIFQIPFPEV